MAVLQSSLKSLGFVSGRINIVQQRPFSLSVMVYLSVKGGEKVVGGSYVDRTTKVTFLSLLNKSTPPYKQQNNYKPTKLIGFSRIATP